MSNHESSEEAKVLKAAVILITIVLAVFPVIVWKPATFFVVIYFIGISALCAYVTTWIDELFPHGSSR